ELQLRVAGVEGAGRNDEHGVELMRVAGVDEAIEIRLGERVEVRLPFRVGVFDLHRERSAVAADLRQVVRLRVGRAEAAGAVDDGDRFLAEAFAHDHHRDEENAAEEKREDERHDDEHLLAHAGEVFAFEDREHLVHHATSRSDSSPTFWMKISSSEGAASSKRRMRRRPIDASSTRCGSAPSINAISAELPTILAARMSGRSRRNAPSPSKSMCSVFFPNEPRTCSSVPSRTTLPR